MRSLSRDVQVASFVVSLVLFGCAVGDDTPVSRPTKPTVEQAPVVGKQAPDFEVKDNSGNVVKLADLRGKRIVLWFYPKAATSG